MSSNTQFTTYNSRFSHPTSHILHSTFYSLRSDENATTGFPSQLQPARCVRCGAGLRVRGPAAP